MAHAGSLREEVRAVLGEPDSETPTSDGYLLGAEPTGVDCHHMVIEYDAHGRVARVRYVHG